MQLLLNVGGPDRVSRVQMAQAVAQFRGYDTSLIKAVSASSVCVMFYLSHFLYGMSNLRSFLICSFWCMKLLTSNAT